MRGLFQQIQQLTQRIINREGRNEREHFKGIIGTNFSQLKLTCINLTAYWVVKEQKKKKRFKVSQILDQFTNVIALNSGVFWDYTIESLSERQQTHKQAKGTLSDKVVTKQNSQWMFMTEIYNTCALEI